MEKKQYAKPFTAIAELADELMFNSSSISSVDGDTGIGFGDSEDAPEEADAGWHSYDNWDDWD